LDTRIRELFPHQQEGVERAIRNGRVLLVRPLGSGKTALGLHVAERVLSTADAPGLWISPAHLLPQLLGEKDRWGLSISIKVLEEIPPQIIPNVLYAMSYDRLRLCRDWVLRHRWNLVVVDEFQHTKNPATQNHQIVKLLSRNVNFFIGMTGVPFQNSPYEFFNLVALVAGKSIQGKLEACLAYKYERKYPWFIRIIRNLLGIRPQRGPITGIQDPDTLIGLLRPHVDYRSPRQVAGQCGIPEVISEIVRVEMRPSELVEYRKKTRTHRKLVDRKFFEDDLEEETLERGFSRVADLRQLLLESSEGPSSKVTTLCQDVQKVIQRQADARVIIFSNFVDHGVMVISRYLNTLHVPHAVYTGEVCINLKTQIIESFKKGTIPVLVLSPVGFEGLNLEGTTHVFIADPHYNPEVTAQLIARATRVYGPVRTVQVFHYLSYSRKLEKGTIDEIILRIAQRKASVNEAIQKLLEDASWAGTRQTL